jgi:hypothetical protein
MEGTRLIRAFSLRWETSANCFNFERKEKLEEFGYNFFARNGAKWRGVRKRNGKMDKLKRVRLLFEDFERKER